MKKHIIFDLDGTLINSFPIMEEAWNVVSNKFNLKITFQEYKKFTGLPFKVIMEKLNLSKIDNEIKNLYFSETKKRSKKIKLVKGSRELLNYLHKKGYLISIITSKPRKSYNTMKSLIPKCVKTILCSDDTNFNKPDKKLIKHLLSKYPNKKNNLTYIGDTIFDLQFSINSNIDFIYFSDFKKNKLPNNIVNRIKIVDELSKVKELL
tara:strand:+ start:460 stop:1080 length:621 start_codon:yes stop_codon:yes gene_type:complete